MNTPFAIEIFYPDGDPENVRVVSKKAWTGKVVYVSRELWQSVAEDRAELKSPGIYVLVGTSNIEDNDDDLQAIYIGQAENLFSRINDHIENPNRDFQSIVYITAGGDFNTTHFRWMEAHLIKQAKSNDRCVLGNRAIPNRPQISEADEVEVKRFVDDITQIFPIVDVGAFAAPKAIKYSPLKDSPLPKSKEGMGELRRSELRKRIVVAFQREKNVTLLKRSQATFYDETKTLHVSCSISKNYRKTNDAMYWFTLNQDWYDFLASGKTGYFLFGMEEQSRALAFPFVEFERNLDKFVAAKNPNTDKSGWSVCIVAQDGDFKFKFKARKFCDLSNYLFEIS